MDHNQNHTSVRWQKIGLSVLCVVLALILLALATVSLYTNYLLNKIGRVNPEDDATLAPWETIPPDDHDPEFTGPETVSFLGSLWYDEPPLPLPMPMVIPLGRRRVRVILSFFRWAEKLACCIKICTKNIGFLQILQFTR